MKTRIVNDVYSHLKLGNENLVNRRRNRFCMCVII